MNPLSLVGNLSLGQTCLDDVQCKGTKNGGNCLNGVCFCEKGFVIQNLRCLQGKLLLLVISNIYSNYYFFELHVAGMVHATLYTHYSSTILKQMNLI